MSSEKQYSTSTIIASFIAMILLYCLVSLVFQQTWNQAIVPVVGTVKEMNYYQAWWITLSISMYHAYKRLFSLSKNS